MNHDRRTSGAYLIFPPFVPQYIFILLGLILVFCVFIITRVKPHY